VIGLLFIAQAYFLSDEGACERWVYDPYLHFTGEEFFQQSSV
jgi:IS5 family transposase